jgi:hypothetical protein
MTSTPTRTVTIKTRSKAVYALIKPYYEKGDLIPGPFKGAEIVGYAHSASPAVVARARRLGAKLARIENGAATCEVRA